MPKPLSDLEHAEHAVERKKRTKTVLEREIAALEGLIEEMLRRAEKEQQGAHED